MDRAPGQLIVGCLGDYGLMVLASVVELGGRQVAFALDRVEVSRARLALAARGLVISQVIQY